MPPVIPSLLDGAAVITALIQDEPCEVFAILCLTTQHRIIASHEISRGSLDTTRVHPRAVCKAALLANAAAIMLCHTHPSGDATPRADDDALTRRLHVAGERLGIDVRDHLVIGDGRSVSVADTDRRYAVVARATPPTSRTGS